MLLMNTSSPVLATSVCSSSRAASAAATRLTASNAILLPITSLPPIQWVTLFAPYATFLNASLALPWSLAVCVTLSTATFSTILIFYVRNVPSKGAQLA